MAYLVITKDDTNGTVEVAFNDAHDPQKPDSDVSVSIRKSDIKTARLKGDHVDVSIDGAEWSVTIEANMQQGILPITSINGVTGVDLTLSRLYTEIKNLRI